MPITQETDDSKIDVVVIRNVPVANDTVTNDVAQEIIMPRPTHVLQPYESEKGAYGKWTHTDTDISGEDSAVQAIATAAWTDTVKANYKTWKESQEV